MFILVYQTSFCQENIEKKLVEQSSQCPVAITGICQFVFNVRTMVYNCY